MIIPAADGSPTLERSAAAVRAAMQPQDELSIVDEPRGASAAEARNRGAARAEGDVIVFVDADVEIHPGALDRLRAAFEADPELVGLFGSYDDAPEGGVVSGFRNLLHHYVHHSSPGRAGTFWAGLGAIRRNAFLEAGGFVEHPIEDIELGMRLVDGGAKIVLDPSVQGKHLKNWKLWGMLKTDFAIRGAPWVGLMLHHRTADAALNLRWGHRLSALATVLLVVSVALMMFWVTAAVFGGLLALNARFYALLVRRRGPFQAAVGVLLHVLHHLTGVAALFWGLLAYARDEHGVRASARPV